MASYNMNRKGNLPMTLLFICAFILVLSAGFTFAKFKRDKIQESLEAYDITASLEFQEKYIYHKSKIILENVLNQEGISNDITLIKQEFRKKILDSSIIEAGNFIGKIRNNDFNLFFEGDKCILEVNDIIISAENGFNKIKRTYDLRIQVKGVYIKENVPTVAEKGGNENKDCKVHFSGGLIADYYRYEDAKNILVSEIMKEDKFSDILGEGEYPVLGDALKKSTYASSKFDHTLDAIALSKGTKVTIYSEKNFNGNILFQGEGPLIVYNKIHKEDELFKEVFYGEWKEPYQSEYPKSVRILSSSDMNNWARSYDYNPDVDIYKKGSMIIECV